MTAKRKISIKEKISFGCIICVLITILALSGKALYAFYMDSEKITNVFMVDIPLLKDLTEDFVLMEHGIEDANKDGLYELTTTEVIENEYTVYPGVNIPKDPFVRLRNLQGEAYLFIEVIGDSNENFNWSIKDCWLETNLTGKKGGTIYVYVDDLNNAVVLDMDSGLEFQEYILDSIDESANGGIKISDNFTMNDASDIKLYAYLVQKIGSNDYVGSFNQF